ncbi:MAG: sulfite exporter TauE/SafE family protein [Anaerolineales bacterium]
MTPLTALLYSFLFGLLHGVLPDEHTWPITFSYAIGGASGWEGIKAGLYFSAAFTLQRTLLSEAAYLALAPFLLTPTINGVVYIIVGVVMTIAGIMVLRRNIYPHFHLLGHHHEEAKEIETTSQVLTRQHVESVGSVERPPVRWTLVHGFIAGFGFGGFSLYINTVAAPAMRSPWLGFLPGLLYGLGTMIVLVIIGYLFGASMHWSHKLSEQEIKRIGSQTGGRTLFFGGLLFALFGIATFFGWERFLPVDVGYVLIGLFMIGIAIPAFVYTLKEVLAARRQSVSGSPDPVDR